LPLWVFPQIFLDIGEFEVKTFNDPLMGNARNLLWFQCFVALELLFQVPFFFAALYYLTSDRTHYPDGFRAACIAYGAHTSTTLIPILASFWSPDHQASLAERATLTSIYFPYLLVPAWLLWTSAMSSSGAEPSGKKKL